MISLFHLVAQSDTTPTQRPSARWGDETVELIVDQAEQSVRPPLNFNHHHSSPSSPLGLSPPHHPNREGSKSKLFKESIFAKLEEEWTTHREKKEAVKRQQDQEKVREHRMRIGLAREKRLESMRHDWLFGIMPHWNRSAARKRAALMVYHTGVPPMLREKLRPLALGNELNINEESFNRVMDRLRRSRRARKNRGGCDSDDDESSDEDGRKRAKKKKKKKKKKEQGGQEGAEGEDAGSREGEGEAEEEEEEEEEEEFNEEEDEGLTMSRADRNQIKLDLGRTFPSLAFFQKGCHMNQDLRDVLEAYCVFRPDRGYTQGMSYLAGHFLLYMCPWQAWVCLCHLMRLQFFKVFLMLDQKQMRARYTLFQLVFFEHIPDLYEHLATLELLPEMYLMEWCMTLFSSKLGMEVLGRVWDGYFFCGETFVYRTGLAILALLRPRLLKADFAEAMMLLQAGLDKISEPELFDILYDPEAERPRLQFSAPWEEEVTRLQSMPADDNVDLERRAFECMPTHPLTQLRTPPPLDGEGDGERAHRRNTT